MIPTVVIDAGPLVALFEARDHQHRWSVAALAVRARLVTCEAVISEACFLLRRGSGKPAIAALFQFMGEGGLTLQPLDQEARALGRLMARYANVPMSFADACLVRLAELNLRARVMTLDRDFSIYRRDSRQVIPLIAPF